jgi:ATP-dependent helicase/nuclease subunit A
MLKSPLGQRMISADKQGNLHREQQFSIGIPATDIYDNLPDTDDVVIVQGIIDAYFREDNMLVIMDYKTDRADEDTLVGRYKAQLDYYAKTMEQLTGCPVKEKVIYSFYLNKEIQL